MAESTSPMRSNRRSLHPLMRSTLKETANALEEHFSERWCIAYGTLLGWYRGRKFVNWDFDCDVLVWPDKSTSLESIRDRLGLNMLISQYKDCRFLWLGAGEGDDQGGTDLLIAENSPETFRVVSISEENHESVFPHVPSTFLSEIEGLPVRVPQNWKGMLQALYPMHESVYFDVKSGQTTNRPLVLVDLCANPFHHGHSDILHRANYYGRVVAGLHSDDDIEKEKGHRPVMSLAARMELVRQNQFVYDVMESPMYKDAAWLRDRGISLAVLGDDYAGGRSETYYRDAETIILPRTPGVSSSEIRSQFIS